MTKLTDAKLGENDSVAGRCVLVLNAVIDDLDALAASITEPDAQAKTYALADEYEKTRHRVVAEMLVGTPAQPNVDPPAPVVHVPLTVSKESADATAHGVMHAMPHRRAPRADRPADAKDIEWRTPEQIAEGVPFDRLSRGVTG